MTEPQVSVLMPVYNDRRYLPAAIESILRQTFKDFELIVIDDGSTDGSEEILRGYAERDARVRLVRRPNKGYVYSLNEAIGMARAPLLARMDSDDISPPDRFAVEIAYLAAHPEVVCVGGYYGLMDYRGRFLTTMTPPTDHQAIDQELLAGHTPLCHTSVMMRRDAVEKVGRYDLTMALADDLDLWLRLAEVGQLAIVPQPMVCVRMRRDSLSGQQPDRQLEVARRACEAAWRRRGISGRFEPTDTSRPLSNRRSRMRFSLLYGWWAFSSGRRSTAALYGLKCLTLAPWHLEGLRLLVCALVKRLPQPQFAWPARDWNRSAS
ncbi:MAG: glycosyltransferase [Phycisphaeraceae bacterium]